MPSAHVSCQVHGRSDSSHGSSSAAGAAAYRSRDEIFIRELGRTRDYSNRDDLVHHTMMTPESLPDQGEWFNSHAEFWNRVDEVETRSDAQLFRELKIGLPRELGAEANAELMEEFIEANFTSEGMVAQGNIHAESPTGNIDGHIMLSLRPVEETEDGEYEFGNKERSWNRQSLVSEWREDWARRANKKLIENGAVDDPSDLVDTRSLTDRYGLDDDEIDRLRETYGINSFEKLHLGSQAYRNDDVAEKKQAHNEAIDRVIREENFEPQPSEDLLPEGTSWDRLFRDPEPKDEADRLKPTTYDPVTGPSVEPTGRPVGPDPVMEPSPESMGIEPPEPITFSEDDVRTHLSKIYDHNRRRCNELEDRIADLTETIESSRESIERLEEAEDRFAKYESLVSEYETVRKKLDETGFLETVKGDFGFGLRPEAIEKWESVIDEAPTVVKQLAESWPPEGTGPIRDAINHVKKNHEIGLKDHRETLESAQSELPELQSKLENRREWRDRSRSILEEHGHTPDGYRPVASDQDNELVRDDSLSIRSGTDIPVPGGEDDVDAPDDSTHRDEPDQTGGPPVPDPEV